MCLVWLQYYNSKQSNEIYCIYLCCCRISINWLTINTTNISYYMQYAISCISIDIHTITLLAINWARTLKNIYSTHEWSNTQLLINDCVHCSINIICWINYCLNIISTNLKQWNDIWYTLVVIDLCIPSF